jgi:hypothetical protein
MPLGDDDIQLVLNLQGDEIYDQFTLDQPYLADLDFVNREPSQKYVEVSKPVGKVQSMELARTTKKAIAVYEDFKKRGVTMQIPWKLTDYSKWLFGDQTIRGTGYFPDLAYKYVAINKIAKARATKKGDYSEQTYKQFIPSIVGQARPELQDGLGRYMNHLGVKYCIYYGQSYELGLSVALGGRAATKTSPAHVWVPGTGLVNYDITKDGPDAYTNLPGTAAYETAIETAVNSILNTAAYQLSLSVFDKLAMVLPKLKIMPTVNYNGNWLYRVMVSTAGMNQLKNDARWQTIVQQIYPREVDPIKNPAIRGGGFMYGGFVFVEDIQSWGVHTNAHQNGYVTAPTNHTIGWGPEDTVNAHGDWNMIKGFDASPWQTFVIMGSRALDMGVAAKPWFTDEIWDHKTKSEIAIHMMGSLTRSTLYDTDNILGNGVNAFIEDTGLLVGVHYADIASMLM